MVLYRKELMDMVHKVIKLTRDNVGKDLWETFCYYLGLIGNYEGEPDAEHFKSIELIIRNIEES